MAINVASVPELWNRSFSMEGINALIARAQRSSSSVDAPRWVPRRICWETASAISGWECPKSNAPWPET